MSWDKVMIPPGASIHDAIEAIEARPPIGWDKGRAFLHVLRSRYGPAWSESVRAIYVGDDETDEDGFRKVNQMNGVSLKVGPGPTVASWRLDDVEAAVRWLQRYLHRFRKGDERIDGTNADES